MKVAIGGHLGEQRERHPLRCKQSSWAKSDDIDKSTSRDARVLTLWTMSRAFPPFNTNFSMKSSSVNIATMVSFFTSSRDILGLAVFLVLATIVF